MLDLKYLFELYGEQLVNDLINRMNEDNSNATGTGAKSLRFKAGKLGLQVTGKKYLGALNDGLTRGQFRSQEKEGAPSPRNIETWLRAKAFVGVDDRSIKNLSFAISRSIQKRGTLASKGYNGQGTDFINFVINKNNKSLIDDVALETLEQFGQQLETEFELFPEIEVK